MSYNYYGADDRNELNRRLKQMYGSGPVGGRCGECYRGGLGTKAGAAKNPFLTFLKTKKSDKLTKLKEDKKMAQLEKAKAKVATYKTKKAKKEAVSKHHQEIKRLNKLIKSEKEGMPKRADIVKEYLASLKKEQKKKRSAKT